MEMSSTRVVHAAPDAVWNALNDPSVLKECIPGCESLEAAGEDRYRAVVVVALAGIKARFDLQVEVTERLADGVRAVTRGEEGGNASTLQATSEVRLSPVAGGTHVDYRSDVAVTGRLGRFALGMMKKKAQSLGDEFAANLQRALAAAQEAAVATTPEPVAAPAPVASAGAAAPATAPQGSWWQRFVQWLRARFGPASPGHS